jgi:hypothetical protein
MVKTKRWGDTFIDKRDWSKYNEQLVKRGEFFLDLDFVKSWNNELIIMNQKKVGAPYRFPNTLIELQAIWHAKRIDFRMIEGITRDLVKIGQLPNYNDYSTSNRRVNKLSCQLALPSSENLTIFTDGTGLRVVEGGEYLREKYGKKNRRWIQVVILGSPDSKEPVSYEVNIIQDSENESARRQVEDLLYDDVSIDQFGGDGAFDKIALWNWLEAQGIEPIIKPDKNAITPSGNRCRDNNVDERNVLGYTLWAREHGYGHRWPATEGIFSAIKRILEKKSMLNRLLE